MTLANKFIKLTLAQPLFPATPNVAIFTPHLSAWCFGSCYRDKIASPYLVSMKKGQDIFVILSAASFRKSAEVAFKRYWKNQKILIKTKYSINRYLKVLEKFYLQCNYNFINRTKLDDLARIAKRVNLANRHLNTLSLVGVYFDEEFSKQLLLNLNININRNRLKEIFNKVPILIYESFEKRRYLNFLKLISQKTKYIIERSQYYFTNYDLISNLEETRRGLQKQYGPISPKQAESLLKKEKRQQKEKLLIYKNWLKSLNKNEQKLAKYLWEIVIFRDIRKDGVAQALTIIHRIAERIFQKAGLNKELIYYCSSEEISRGIKYFLKNKKNIEKRPHGITMLFIYNKNKTAAFEYGTYEATKKKLVKYYRERFSKKIYREKIIEIKGQIAYPGKVKGRVKIVFEPRKVKRLKKGDILVTSMTRPEFIALVKQSSAIITDEGGITCHASIVSRELKIPCIIGTKIATKTLKDGDCVEVDAEKGIVRIIKKAG